MDLGQLLQALGTSGVFVWFLVNDREKTRTSIEKNINNLTDAVDDNTLVILDFVDTIRPDFSRRGNIAKIKNKVIKRKEERNK